jgi:uncharacterized protein YciI
MLYAIFARDVPESFALRHKLRPAHLSRLRSMRDEGRLILAGPHPASDAPDSSGFTGSLIVAEFESLAAAHTWIEADPFKQGGVYAEVTVLPFTKVLP